MTTVHQHTSFPLDWDEFETQYNAWRGAQDIRTSVERIRGKNFLADEILGTYKCAAGIVELSAVTFPNLSERDEQGNLRHYTLRYIGLTWLVDGKNVNGGLVETFAELESAIERGPES